MDESSKEDRNATGRVTISQIEEKLRQLSPPLSADQPDEKS